MIVAVVAGLGTVAFRRAIHSCDDLGDVGRYPRGSVSFIGCVPAFVVNRDGSPIVFLARSPHLPNESIAWDPRRKLFVSVAHGETFDIDGHLVNGPAIGGLWRCPTEARGQELFISMPIGSTSDLVTVCYGSSPPPW